MKIHRDLFERYSKSALEEAGVDELNRLLIGIYFSSKEELNQDELEYTEDLLFDLYVNNQLEEKYSEQFKDKISKDRSLQKKYSLFRSLDEASDSLKSEKQRLMLNSDVPDKEKKEEEQLDKILQEVIEKVHAEKEAQATNPWMENLAEKLKSFFNSLVSFNQPQVKLAMVFASLTLLVVIVWVTVKPGKESMTAVNINKDTLNNNQIATIDTTEIKKPDIQMSRIEEMEIEQTHQYANADSMNRKREGDRRKKIIKETVEPLLAYMKLLPPFSYVLTRSITSSASDSFILAADNYNEKDYDSCILILNDLLKKNVFHDKDTLNEINFYLGCGYLAVAFEKNQDKKLKSAINSFANIDSSSVYYNDSRWYRALALIKRGKEEEGVRMLNSLLQINYLRDGEVKSLRDSLVPQKTR